MSGSSLRGKEIVDSRGFPNVSGVIPFGGKGVGITVPGILPIPLSTGMSVANLDAMFEQKRSKRLQRVDAGHVEERVVDRREEGQASELEKLQREVREMKKRMFGQSAQEGDSRNITVLIDNSASIGAEIMEIGEGDDWRSDLHKYLSTNDLPEDKRKVERIKARAVRFRLIGVEFALQIWGLRNKAPKVEIMVAFSSCLIGIQNLERSCCQAMQIHRLGEDEIGAGSSIKESSDYSCASSVTDDDFYVSKAPGVVAKLMGLDCLPISNIYEPYSTPLSDCQSRLGSHYKTKNLEYFQDLQFMHSSSLHENVPFMEPKYQKVLQKPIKKFQNEILPPKSAKSIPITHHRLLSPIKSSNYIPSMDAAKKSVRDLKEKVQVAKKTSKCFQVSHRPSESSAVKNLRGHSINKSWNGIVIPNSEESSVGVKNKGKSISLALQAKANVQKREALNLHSSRASNNQKQNCTIDRGKSHLKPTIQLGKAVNGEFSSARQRKTSKLVGPSKVGSQKLASEVKDDKRQVSSCKKRSIDGSYHHSDKIQDAHDLSGNENRKVVRSSAVTDVVSFTFTAPMTQQGPSSVGSADAGKNCKIFQADSPGKRIMLDSDGMVAQKFSSLGHNVKGGDILSTFLEQKLKELTHKIEFSQQRSGTVSLVGSSVLEENKTKDGNYAYKQEGQPGFSLYSSRDPRGFITDQKCQNPVDEMGMHRRNMSEERSLLDFRLPSPVSVLDHFSISESCHSSDTADTNSTGGAKHCSPIQFHDVLSRYSMNTFPPLEGDAELSDSSSSTSAGNMPKRRETTPYCKKPRGSKLEYVKEILCNIDMMFNDYALGNACHIIIPRLFDQVERRKGCLNGCENISRTDRRLLFDCVNECLDMRCRRYVRGGYKLWAKGLWMVKKTDRLAEDVCKEISGWSEMGDFMVDEIVEYDMSSQYGRWLDYEIEAFECGIQIESKILSSLIDEVVDDILVL
ncbi:hypothetical protein DH2020_004406 [Rehmannia glutinosa]|uniref:DUF4378 domain-containing protein n=1 Tax=Rehmannia glutinosa TaxID=99300 RepID=A0ABR0XPC2_REHGL